MSEMRPGRVSYDYVGAEFVPLGLCAFTTRHASWFSSCLKCRSKQ